MKLKKVLKQFNAYEWLKIYNFYSQEDRKLLASGTQVGITTFDILPYLDRKVLGVYPAVEGDNAEEIYIHIELKPSKKERRKHKKIKAKAKA